MKNAKHSIPGSEPAVNALIHEAHCIENPIKSAPQCITVLNSHHRACRKHKNAYPTCYYTARRSTNPHQTDLAIPDELYPWANSRSTDAIPAGGDRSEGGAAAARPAPDSQGRAAVGADSDRAADSR